jgi:beta-phosphoglucomutase-like phosphatase (HAD superfamily)
VFPGVSELVRSAAASLPIAIASVARRAEIETVLARAQLSACFEGIVSADDVRHGKPAPDVYLAALALLRQRHPALEAKACLVLEDAPNGIRAARAAGMPVVAISTSAGAEALSMADAVLSSLVGVGLNTLSALIST